MLLALQGSAQNKNDRQKVSYMMNLTLNPSLSFAFDEVFVSSLSPAVKIVDQIGVCVFGSRRMEISYQCEHRTTLTDFQA